MATLLEPEVRQAVLCSHCGLPVPPGDLEPSDSHQFCCAGCRTVFGVLHAGGLSAYYSLPERGTRPVRSAGRSYDEFDHEAFHDLYVTQTTSGLARVTLVLEGVHCASCVWLVERVPLLVSGLVRAELDVRRGLVTVEWDAAAQRLSEIARTLSSLGYPPHPYRGGTRDALRIKENRAAIVRIGVAGAIAINVMLATLAIYSGWFGSGLEREYDQYFRWLSLLLVTPSLFGPGRLFYRGAWAALRTHTLHLDLPIAIALTAGYVRGAINTVSGEGPLYLDGVAVLVFLLLVGRFLQQKWQRSATDASELLHSLTPHGCRIVERGTNGEELVREVPSSALTPGMILDVRAGDTIAADGLVERGESSVSLAWLTGESKPQQVSTGVEVFAGAVNIASPIRVAVTKAGEETRVARVLQQAEETSKHKAPIVLLANRMAGAFVAIILVLAAITYAMWVGRDASAALDHAIALLVVTCPCALAMATPLSVTVALGRAARNGIFVKSGEALEALAKPTRMLLDKTGTLTAGESALVQWDGPEWVRPLILALEEGSQHPVAEGFRRAWSNVPFASAKHVDHTIGGGVEGSVDGRTVCVGSPKFVAPRISAAPSDVAPNNLLTPVWIAVDGVFVARAGFGDPVRSDSAIAVSELRQRGWHLGILSGDSIEVAQGVAAAVGIAATDVVAHASPEGKLAAVRSAKERGPIVMVGDGVNDSAAIAEATVGIAVHGGAEAAMSTADVYLTKPGLAPLVQLVDGATATMRVIRRNIAFSLVYNVVGIVLAMTGTINPVIAAVMMPLSSLTVVAGAWYGHSFAKEPIE